MIKSPVVLRAYDGWRRICSDRYLVSAIDDWAPHWLPACLWYSFLMQMFCTSNHQYKVGTKNVVDMGWLELTPSAVLRTLGQQLNDVYDYSLVVARLKNLQRSMSSHLVPALRALLPVAFLCEVSPD